MFNIIQYGVPILKNARSFRGYASCMTREGDNENTSRVFKRHLKIISKKI